MTKPLYSKSFRYPSGTHANYWEWQTGWFIDNQEILPKNYKNLKSLGYDLLEFKKIIDCTGAKPIFVLNLLTKDLNDQLAMLEKAQAIGLEVKFIELGNEYYNTGYKKTYMNIFEKPIDYITMANQWAKVIKQHYPEARIAVVGNDRDREAWEQFQGNWAKPLKARLYVWNQIVVDNMSEDIDAMTIHIYASPILGTTLKKDKVSEYLIKKNLQDATLRRAILTLPFIVFEKVKEKQSILPDDKNIWITEYNLLDKTKTISSTWLHGLLIGLITLKTLEIKATELINYHDLVGFKNFGTIIGFSDKNYYYSATGEVLQLISKALDQSDKAYPLIFNPNPFIVTEKGKYPSFYGWQLVGKTEVKNIIFNLSDTVYTLQLSSCADSLQYYQSLKQEINKFNKINKEEYESKDLILLQPYSITSSIEKACLTKINF